MYSRILKDSPVETALKAGPRGDGNWPGYADVYAKISAACDAMGRDRYKRCSDIHVETMADLGSGHEERMKYRLHWLRTYGYV
jgi:hypothetical protein